MKIKNKYTRLLALYAALAIFSFSELALAVDDGARAYWKTREGSTVLSFQYLDLSLQASGAQQFDPGQFIYPHSDVEAKVFVASWVRHMTLFNRASSLSVGIAGGSARADISASMPPQFLPPGAAPGVAFSQSSSGYADPTVQLDINLIGTSRLKSNVDLFNYEPTLTVDAAVMMAVPIGEYDETKLVNMGLNRWWGRFALPVKYHFGVFSPGYMSSFELTPSIWVFAENDDFVGKTLDNDPILQLEAHLTQDFTPSFFGSLDLLYRGGFQSSINGADVGEELDIGNLGFTLNFTTTDNLMIRTSFSSNVFGDEDVDNSILRLQLVYVWHKSSENFKKLNAAHH
ncbi:MAG: hypothetical protein KAJ32_10060 [Gammaproteobacteria bacterium]|nr:hypothetical protein [Gammaproteobacteria bacterium]